MTTDGRSSPKDETAPHDCSGAREEYTYVEHGDGALDSSLRRNVAQALTVVAFMIVGAGIGFFMVDDRPEFAALGCAVLGMIAGTFLSGFVLMLLPTRRIKVTRVEIQREYAAWSRRLWISGITGMLMLLCLPLVLGLFGHDSSVLSWLFCLGWILGMIRLSTYYRGLALRMREWRCPRCNAALGAVRPVCAQCGFPMLRSATAERESS